MSENISFSAAYALGKKEELYEASYSLAGFRLAIKEALLEVDFSSLSLQEYSCAVPDSIKHSTYHKELMSQVKINFEKVFVTVIESITMNHSYLEHRILGYQIGKKVTPKTVIIDGKRLRSSVSTKLSLGSNIVQYLKVKGFLKNKVFPGSNDHTRNVVEATDTFREFLEEAGLYLHATKVRSGGAGYRMLKHSPEQAGGNYLSPSTMLKGIELQSTQACEALNKCQLVPFRLKSNEDLVEILKEYKLQDKWFDKYGIFMEDEWNKLISDLTRFKDEIIYIPYAMEATSGRMHSRSYYLNPQGDSFQKSMFTIDGEDIYKYDCRNNNLQIYALLGSDEAVGARVGLTPTELEDLRIELANRLNEWTGLDIFNKDTVKHLVMIAFYGGMEKQLLDNIDTIKDDLRYAGKYTFRELVPEDKQEDLYKFIMDTLEELAPAAMILMNLMYAFNDEDKTHYELIMPDGFKVSYYTTQVFVNKGFYVDIAEERTVSVSVEAELPYNTKYNRSLAPNLIRAVESYIAREVVRRADFPITLVHDSYGVRKQDIEAVNYLVKEVMADVNDMDLLKDMLTQLNPKKKFRIKKGGLTREMIMSGSPLALE